MGLEINTLVPRNNNNNNNKWCNRRNTDFKLTFGAEAYPSDTIEGMVLDSLTLVPALTLSYFSRRV